MFKTRERIRAGEEMKYRDIITTLAIVAFLCSLGYAAMVATSLWFWGLPILLFIVLIFLIYKLWIEK